MSQGQSLEQQGSRSSPDGQMEKPHLLCLSHNLPSFSAVPAHLWEETQPWQGLLGMPHDARNVRLHNSAFPKPVPVGAMWGG